MSSVQWIKLSTKMFDDEKILLIEAMPEADAILYVWLRLLVQAGKTNSSGFIFLAENVPYTVEMMSTIFRRPLNIIRLALKTLRDLQMIEIMANDMVCVLNWEKHQNIEGLEKMRENARLRKQKQRNNQKLLISENVTVTVTPCHALEEEKEEEKEKEKEKEQQEQTPAQVVFQNLATEKNFGDTPEALFIKYFNRKPSHMEIQTAKEMIAEHGDSIVRDAFHKAMIQSKFSIAYAKGIIKKEIEKQAELKRKAEADAKKVLEQKEKAEDLRKEKERMKIWKKELWEKLREKESTFSDAKRKDIIESLNDDMLLRADRLLNEIESNETQDSETVKTITELTNTFSTNRIHKNNFRRKRT